jgi:hypothetical protein
LSLHLNAGPADRFRDPKTFAAEHWYATRVGAHKWVASYRRFKEGLPPVHRPSAYAVPKPADKVEKRAVETKREREARLERGRAFVRLMRSKEKKEYGPHSFPLAAQVKAINAEKVETIIPGVGRMPWGEQSACEALKCFRVLELCEVAIWGEVLDETREALAEMSSAVEAFVVEREQAAAEKLRQEEERRAEDEQRRAEREQQRARADYTAASAVTPIRPAQESPVPRFRAPAARSFDLTGAHVPEPARMVTVPDPADPSKNMVLGRSIGPETYDPNHPDAVQFQRSSSPKDLPDHERYYRGEYYDGDPRY